MGFDIKILAKIAKKNIDLAGMSFDIIDMIIRPGLEKAVLDSSNKLDDATLALIYPIIEKEGKEFLAKEIAKLYEKIEA